MSDKDTPQDPQDPKDTPDTGGDDKDYKAEAEKWKVLARKHEAQAKANADAARKLAEIDDADKSEIQKAADRAAAAEKRAEEAELRALRLEVAGSKGISSHASRLVGTTREELEADAEEFAKSLQPPDGRTPPPGKPQESLRGGADPTEEPEEMDPRKLADMVPRN